MVTILADGDGRHRLENAQGVSVGSVAHGTIRIDGIPLRTILGAGVALFRALDAALARQFPGWARHHPEPGSARLVQDGADQWISDGARLLARVAPADGRATLRGSASLEFGLPWFATDAVLITSATSMIRALEAFRSDGDPAPAGFARASAKARPRGGGDAA